MRVIRSKEFKTERAWGATEIERISSATVRLDWTDESYIWHVNDEPEVFIVVDGVVNMHVRGPAGEQVIRLETGDIFHTAQGDEHRASPVGQARVVVVETAGSA